MKKNSSQSHLTSEGNLEKLKDQDPFLTIPNRIQQQNHWKVLKRISSVAICWYKTDKYERSKRNLATIQYRTNKASDNLNILSILPSFNTTRQRHEVD